MFNRTKVRRALNKLSSECGSSRDVANKLKAMGIKGTRDNANTCPLAVYIRTETGLNVKVDYQRVTDGFLPIKLNNYLEFFVLRFDEECYPELDISVVDDDNGSKG